MPTGTLNHIELRCARPNATIPFYKDFLSYFDWQVIAEFDGGIGMGDGNTSLWFFPPPEENRQHEFDRESTGIRHFGIHVHSKEDVDKFYQQFMQPRGVEAQFETPRARE